MLCIDLSNMYALISDRYLVFRNSLQEARVCRLLLVVLIPNKCSSLAGKDARNPRVLIRDTLSEVSLI